MQTPNLSLKNKILFFSLFSLFIGFFSIQSAFTLNPIEWIQKLGKPKKKVKKPQKTMVAAVRGITDPSQVNLKLRNFDGVEWMEGRIYDSQTIEQFINAGNLSDVQHQEQ